MKRFILEQSETEFYTSHSGLALVGLCLNQYGQLNQALEKGIPLRHGISHADIIKSPVGWAHAFCAHAVLLDYAVYSFGNDGVMINGGQILPTLRL